MDDIDPEIGSYGDNAEIELDYNLGIELEGEDLSEEGLDVDNSKSFVYYPQVGDEFTPKQGQKFQTLDDVHTFYNTYAMHAGFSVRKWNEKKKVGSHEICRKEYVCYKQGKGKMLADVDSKRKRGSTREGCTARIVVVRRYDLYETTIFEEGHCHPLSTPHKKHLLRSHRNVSIAQKTLSQQLDMVNIPQCQQYKFLAVQAGGFENIGCTKRDLYNFQRDKRNELKGHDGDMLNEYLKLEQQKNPSFTFTIDTDDENRITRCFWADAHSRRAYTFYGDVVIFGRALQHQRHEELISDNKDLIERPKMKICHDFLSQMVDIYTHSSYYKFENELCESFNYRFELMKEDVNYHVYKIYRRNVSKFKVREIQFDKSLDYAKCSCKKFESSGIVCRHVIAYLNKYHDLDQLPRKYVLKRWTKTAKTSGVSDDNALAIKDDKLYLLTRSQLIQQSLDFIDRALPNEEATKILKECFSNVDEKIKEVIGKKGSERNNPIESCGISASKSVNKSGPYEHSYIEPSQVRAKGCGKRLKGGKERALGKTKNPNGRRCHGCGKVGVTHDKRNCPVLNNRTVDSTDDAQDLLVDDDSDSPTEWASQLQ